MVRSSPAETDGGRAGWGGARLLLGSPLRPRHGTRGIAPLPACGVAGSRCTAVSSEATGSVLTPPPLTRFATTAGGRGDETGTAMAFVRRRRPPSANEGLVSRATWAMECGASFLHSERHRCNLLCCRWPRLARGLDARRTKGGIDAGWKGQSVVDALCSLDVEARHRLSIFCPRPGGLSC